MRLLGKIALPDRKYACRAGRGRGGGGLPGVAGAGMGAGGHKHPGRAMGAKMCECNVFLSPFFSFSCLFVCLFLFSV